MSTVISHVKNAYNTHFIERLRAALLRGGRITKVKGQAASYAPDLGISNAGASRPAIFERVANIAGTSVSVRALGARAFAVALAAAGSMALTVTGANAGVCTETFAGSGIFVCSGAAAGGDVTQTPTPPAGGALDVSTIAGFGITTAAGNAITMINVAGDTDITFTDNNSSVITGNANGLYAANNGTGLVSITTTGAVTGTTGVGIQAYNNTGTSLTVNAQGAVTGNLFGVYAGNFGTGALSITTQAVTASVFSGIIATNSGAGTSLTINAQGAVNGGNVGISAQNNGTGVTSITTSGGVTGTVGIRISARANNSPTTITNSGTITGTGGVAINFQGNGNDTLNLNGGSIINGTIDFGDGNDGLGGTNANDVDRLNVAPGLNAVLTFADASGGDSALASAPESASSNVAFFNGGTQAAAVDPTGFAASGVFLGTLTTAIFNSIDNNGSGPQGGQPLTGGISPAGGDAKSLAYGSGRRLWVSGFGGKQGVDGTSSQAGIDNRFGGAITGVEIGVGGKGAFGVFGGYAVSSLDIEYNAGDLEVDSAFGGAYWKIDTGKVRIQLALVAGSANQDSTRNIAGGTTARGEADGWFFSPSATLAVPIEGLSFPLIASARVSYAGLFIDGYTETGVANPLTVGDRDVQVFNTRAQFTLPQIIANKNGSKTRIDWRAGIDAQFDGGSDNVALTVGGTPLSFSANLNDEVAGFFGASLIHNSENGMYTFTASGEVQSAFNGGYKAVGQIRALVNF